MKPQNKHYYKRRKVQEKNYSIIYLKKLVPKLNSPGEQVVSLLMVKLKLMKWEKLSKHFQMLSLFDI